jgi:hypothetical protein
LERSPSARLATLTQWRKSDPVIDCEPTQARICEGTGRSGWGEDEVLGATLVPAADGGGGQVSMVGVWP